MTKKSNIILIGFMGSGKTTIGKLLEKKSGKKFIDMDKLIEKKAGTSIRKIFELHGEEHFRDLESASVKSIAKNQNLVVSTGGGVVKRPENMKLLKKNGTVVYLKTGFKTVVKRVFHRKTRPLFNQNDLHETEALFNKRLPVYRAYADLTVTTDDKEKKKSPGL